MTDSILAAVQQHPFTQGLTPEHCATLRSRRRDRQPPYNDNTRGGMEQMELLLAQLRRHSHPGSAFSALFERRAPASKDRSRTRAANEPGEARPLTSSGSGLRASIATTAEQLAAAAALVESRYAWRGYSLQPGVAATPPGVTLVALQTGATLGTVTLRLDGPAGLAADEGYGATIDAARARGRRVCELTRLAIDSAADWRTTLGALFGFAYLVAFQKR